MQYFNLFVKRSSRPSKDILAFVRDNIDSINDMGVHISIRVIDEADLDKDFVAKLDARGIHRFPALVSDKNVVNLGKNKIEKLFIDNMKTKAKFDMEPKRATGPNPYRDEAPADSNLESFWASEMSMEAIKRDASGPKDDEAFSGHGDNFQRRMEQQNKQRKYQGTGTDSSFDMSSQMTARNAQRARSNTQHNAESVPQQRDYNNIPSDEIKIDSDSRTLEDADPESEMDRLAFARFSGNA